MTRLFAFPSWETGRGSRRRLSSWRIFVTASQAAALAFRTTWRALSRKGPGADPSSPAGVRPQEPEEMLASFRAQLAESLGEKDPLFRLMEETFRYLAATAAPAPPVPQPPARKARLRLVRPEADGA